MLGIVVVFFVAVLGFAVVRVGSAVLGSQHASFEVSDAGLRLRGDFYGRTIPRDALVGHGIKIVNLEQESGLRPVRALARNHPLTAAQISCWLRVRAPVPLRNHYGVPRAVVLFAIS